MPKKTGRGPHVVELPAFKYLKTVKELRQISM